MPLQSSGSISVANVAVEFGDVAPHSMSEFYAKDVGVPTSGTIGLTSFYGKANKFVATLASNAQELNLYTWLTGMGWNQFSRVELTIASGVYVWSDNTSVAALNMGGSYPNGLVITNNGFIMGKGGNGANATWLTGSEGLSTVSVNGSPGGPAINLTGPVTINNTNGYIGGGGGGGGAGAGDYYSGQRQNGGGGGAGGGLGGKTLINNNGTAGTTDNGPGGAIGQVGTTTIINPQGLTTAYVVYPTHGGAGGYAGAQGQNSLSV